MKFKLTHKQIKMVIKAIQLGEIKIPIIIDGKTYKALRGLP